MKPSTGLNRLHELVSSARGPSKASGLAFHRPAQSGGFRRTGFTASSPVFRYRRGGHIKGCLRPNIHEAQDILLITLLSKYLNLPISSPIFVSALECSACSVIHLEFHSFSHPCLQILFFIRACIVTAYPVLITIRLLLRPKS